MALAEPAALDAEHLGAGLVEKPRHVAQGVELGELEAEAHGAPAARRQAGHEEVERPQGEDDDRRADEPDEVVARAHGQPDRRGRPEAGRGRQAADERPVMDDGARAEEPDAGDDLGRDPGRVRLRATAAGDAREPIDREHREGRRTQRDEEMGARSRRVLVDLAFEPDRGAQHGGDQ